MYDSFRLGAIRSMKAMRSSVCWIVMGVSTSTASLAEYIKVQEMGDQCPPPLPLPGFWNGVGGAMYTAERSSNMVGSTLGYFLFVFVLSFQPALNNVDNIIYIDYNIVYPGVGLFIYLGLSRGGIIHCFDMS